MNDASTNQNYEHAAFHRDRIKALSKLEAKQSVHLPAKTDADVFALAHEHGRNATEVFLFRGGRHLGNQSLFAQHATHIQEGELLSAIIAQFYTDKTPPPQILVSHRLKETAWLEDALSTKAQYKVRIHHPQKGRLHSIINHALDNARANLIKTAYQFQSDALHKALEQLLALNQSLARIEIFDNSHFKGAHPLGVMVVADAQGFNKDQYRRFNIKTAPTQDDPAMMKEVLTRRLKRLLLPESDPQHMPSLILIDGGGAQLNAAASCLEECGLSEKIAIAAIAKGAEGRSGFETLYRPDKPPIPMGEHTPVFAYLRRLRDEAHRYAIGSHRQRRNKDIVKSQLDAIPHIGQKRKKALLEHFGDVAAIKQAAIDDLKRVKGISHANAQSIFEWFHNA